MAATLREHTRTPGMGETTARLFRDKLAMRVQARDEGILVPDFVPVLNYDQIRDFTERASAPWVLKPRSEAATFGIKKVYSAGELWPLLDTLGDRQSYYLLEQYIFGDVCHVDAITYQREILFTEFHKYGTPPLDVTYEGGLFTSSTLPRTAPDAHRLRTLHREVLGALHFVRGVTHTEFIREHDSGRFYFLETAARAGGAHLVEMIEAATGINMWVEWAKIEIAGSRGKYTLPVPRQDYSGIIVSLARQEQPDTSAYNDPEVVLRLNEHHHAGIVLSSKQPERIEELLESYSRRFYDDFYASQPHLDKPPA
jgi:biotin carboxylase